eukprot:5479738-Prorocentrum_lima.AAC.1
MAHTGQVDGLAENEHDGPIHEGPRRKEVKMMKGVIQMMKHQLKEFKELPSSTHQIGSQPDDLQVRTEE